MATSQRRSHGLIVATAKTMARSRPWQAHATRHGDVAVAPHPQHQLIKLILSVTDSAKRINATVSYA